MVMKGFLKFLNTALGLAALVGMCACSNMEVPKIEEEVEEATPLQLFNKIAAGEKVTACYVRSDYHLFGNDERLGDKWEEVDLTELCGWSTSLPYRINIIDSQVSLPYKMDNLIDGGSPLSMAWVVYCIATNTNPQLCVLSDMEVDRENKTVTIGAYTCAIENETETGFLLTYESPYWYHDNDGNSHEGTHREMLTYDQEVLDEATQENMWIYNSEYDLIVDLLARFRATFGDEVNLNTYLYPNIILDDPIVNFDELEETLLASYSK